MNQARHQPGAIARWRGRWATSQAGKRRTIRINRNVRTNSGKRTNVTNESTGNKSQVRAREGVGVGRSRRRGRRCPTSRRKGVALGAGAHGSRRRAGRRVALRRALVQMYVRMLGRRGGKGQRKGQGSAGAAMAIKRTQYPVGTNHRKP